MDPDVNSGDGCPDCSVAVGEPHRDGCDVARCLDTGQQRLSCDDGMDDDFEPIDNGDHDCGQDVWTGDYPGRADCERLGIMVRYLDEATGEPVTDAIAQMGPNVRVEQCGTGDPGAEPDLNRLMNPGGPAYWDRESKRWEAR